MRTFKFIVAGALALAGLAAVAQQVNPLAPPTRTAAAASTPAPTPASSADRLTPADVNAWLDGFMPYALAEADVAGAVVTVVRNGEVVTERGFGYADVASRRPVDPQLTLFRPGSVSKLITWTAVMQQVEQGKIDLDADVNRYLDFRIPEYDGQPVTMRQIMTHTAGFEEQLKDLIGHDRAGVPPYDELLKRWVPPRIFAPGTTPAYSNYATSLAGYIVQRVSGENFDDYVERHIFAPLGMRNSSMRQPLPANMRAQMATGYQRASGEPVPFEIVGPAPAGSLSSTGADMSRFMLAHLNGGELNGQRILSAETARQMHRTAAPGIGPLDRMLLGFFETNINGRNVIAHLGDTGAFHTSLHLFLDENTGLYASFNSGGEQGAVNGVRIGLFEQFADRYFPAPHDTRRVPAETAREHAQLMAGNWTASRRADSTFLNITELLGQTSFSVGKDGELVTGPGFGLSGHPTRWVEVEPFLWHDLNSHQRLAAVVENGVPVRFSFSIVSAFTVYDRPPTWKNAALVMPLLQIALAILLLTALFWPVRWLVRRHHKQTFALTGRELLGYRLSRGAALAIVLVIAGWATTITMLFSDLNNLGGAFDGVILTLQVLSFIIFFGGLAVFLWYAWQVWRGKRRWTAKLWSVLLVLAALVVIWVGFAFHLLSLGTGY
ncbi:MAG: serine hydrolase domain-containing protein [Allosphingosinicella sp.]